jgi:hypothetical protein
MVAPLTFCAYRKSLVKMISLRLIGVFHAGLDRFAARWQKFSLKGNIVKTKVLSATGIVSTSVLSLLLGTAIHVYAQQDQHGDKQNQPKQEQQQSQPFSDLFLSFLLARSMRIQADLVDQLFNSSEKRLARILLLMAEFGKPGEPEMLIPQITQETLAEMIGTTRSRVSFFMNRFRKLGFIEYNGRIRVHKSLLNVVLHDQLPEHNAVSASILVSDKDHSEQARKKAAITGKTAQK